MCCLMQSEDVYKHDLNPNSDWTQKNKCSAKTGSKTGLYCMCECFALVLSLIRP